MMGCAGGGIFIKSWREEVTAAACGLDDGCGGVPLGRAAQPPSAIDITDTSCKNAVADFIT
jgi:hypothetical protein